MERAPTRRIPPHPAPAKGFTLVEMVVTILVIGILASFSYVSYTKAVNNQRQTNATAQAQVIAAADQQYYNDKGVYTDINTLISQNYLANQNWSSQYFTYAGGTAGNNCLAAQATPNAGYSSLTPIYVGPDGHPSSSYPASCSQYGGVASASPQMVTPSTLPPSPSSLCTPKPCLAVSQVACGETFTDNCGTYCGTGQMCSGSGATCTSQGVCSGGTSPTSPPPPPPPPPPCTPSCSPILACGSTASNGCGGTCRGYHCPVGLYCLSGLYCQSLGGGGYGCFVAGTPVMTPAGSVPIEKIKPGDVVYAADPASYALVPEKVRATEVKTVRVLVEVVLSNGLKITTTPIHPFFDPADGRFKEIQYFKPGDSVALLQNVGAAPQSVALAQGDPHFTPAMEWNVKITSLRRVKKTSTVYNLTMSEPYPDFLVDGILVHNKRIMPIP